MDYRDVTVRLLGDVAGYVNKMGLAGDITADFVKTISGMEQRLDRLRISAGKTALAMGAGMQASLTGATFAAARWEAQFSNVRKTVDATGSELNKLERNLRQLSTQLPVSAGELANLAAIAGQLGVSTDKIDEFALVGAKLGVATELSSEQAIVSLSRLIKVMNASEGDIEGLGASLVYLGNISNAAEGPILDFAQNIAGTAGSFGIGAAAVMGIATAFSEAGIESEAGGTAVQRVLIEMQTAAKTGGSTLTTFARTLGMTTQQFSDLVKNDPTEAFLRFNEALKAAGGDSIRILKDLKLDDARLIRAFTNVANASGSMRERVDQANQSFKDQSALNAEAATRFNTLLEALKQFRNATAEVLRSFGDPFVEAVTRVVKIMTSFVNIFANAPPFLKDMVAVMAGMSAGFLVAVGSALLLAKTVGTVLTVFRLLKTTIPLTIIKGLAAGFTEITVAGRQMGYMSRGLNSQSLAMQRLFEFSRQAAVGMKGLTAGVAQFLGMAAANKIKGVGLALASAVAKPVGLITGQRQAAKIIQDAADMQKRINDEIGKQTGQIPMSGMQNFWRRTKQGYYQLTASIGDAFRQIPDLAQKMRQQAGQTESIAQRIRRIFSDLAGSFSNMMARMNSGGKDAGFLDLTGFTRKKRSQQEDGVEQLALFDMVANRKAKKNREADRDIVGSSNGVKTALGEQLDLFSDVGNAADESGRKKKRDAEGNEDIADSAEDAAGGMSLLEGAIMAGVAAFGVWASWQQRVADRLGSTQSQAKQVAESMGLVYDQAIKLGNVEPPKTEESYKTADFGKKYSEILAAMGDRDNPEAQLDVVRNLVINTQLNGTVTPEFLKEVEGILKRIFGEKKGTQYYIELVTEFRGPDGTTGTAADIQSQIDALTSYVPDSANLNPGKGTGNFNPIANAKGMFNDISTTLLGARGEGAAMMKSVAEQFVQALGSDEAGGAAGAQAIMKSFFKEIDAQTGDKTASTRLKRQFLGMVEDASLDEGSGKKMIDFDAGTSSYKGAVGDLKEMKYNVLGAAASLDELIAASRKAQEVRSVAIASVKEETGLYKILKDVKYEEAAGDNAMATSRFQRAVQISQQTVGLRETVNQLKQYRTNLGEAASDGEEFRRVTTEIERLEKQLRELDLKKLDRDLAGMTAPDAVRRLNDEILALSNSVDGFDQEKLDAIYDRRDQQMARAESELRAMVAEEEALRKRQSELNKLRDERDAANAKRRDEALERQKKSHNQRMEQIQKQQDDAIKRSAENYEKFADPMSRMDNQRTEATGAIAANIIDQNKIFEEMQANLAKLRGMGLSEEVIKALGLDDPKNAQQVARTLADAMANPKTIEEINAAWKGRIKLSDVYAKDTGNAEIAKIKDDFKEMREEAEKQFKEANDAIQKDYSENADEIKKEYVKQSEEITAALGRIGKQAGDSIEEVIKKAGNSSIEAIRNMGKQVTDVMAEIAQVAGVPIVVAPAAMGYPGQVPGWSYASPYGTTWWAYLGFQSPVEASAMGFNQADARAQGWVGDQDPRVASGTNGGIVPGLALGGLVTKPGNFMVGEAGSPEAVIPLNDRGARFFSQAMTKNMERYRQFGSSSNGGGGTSMQNLTNFTGAVTVVAQDPNEMARKLKQKARLQRLTSPSFSGVT